MLKIEDLTPLYNFGLSQEAPSWVYQPQSADEVAEIFHLARREGLQVALRGAGRSYNDAALNGGGIILDMRGMQAIESWDAQTGVMRVQPGVTLQAVWQRALPDGWWPPVVSGTMTTTVGGCLGMNVHGKNNYRAGVFGEHVHSLTVVLPTGERLVCSPREQPDLFYAIISGMGLLGVVVSAELQMRQIYSGYLNVQEWRTPDLESSLQAVLEAAPKHDYVVGWLDSTARGKALGRGQMHLADYLAPGEDPHPEDSLRVDFQTLPDRFFGLVPKHWLPTLMRPFMNRPGLKLVNTAKYYTGRSRRYLQTHAAFHFLLDYIPDWEKAYAPCGLIQYQSFLPKDKAAGVWRTMLSVTQERRLPSYLAVLKRHRPDKFLLTHALDGFSLALDFKVTPRSRKAMRRMLDEFDELVVAAGGRFYFAKNSETRAETARFFLGEDTCARLRALKMRCDPENLLASDLSRRVLGL